MIAVREWREALVQGEDEGMVIALLAQRDAQRQGKSHEIRSLWGCFRIKEVAVI